MRADRGADGRRRWGLLVLGLAVVAACAPTRPSTSTSLVATSTPSPVPGASGADAVSACILGDVTGRATRQFENGGVNIEIDLVNHTLVPCWFPTVPTAMSLVQPGSDQLPLQAAVSPDASQGRTIIGPGPDSTASLVLHWSNWCAADPGELLAVLTPQEVGDQLTMPLVGSQVPRCDDPTRPSSLEIDGILSTRP